MSKNILISAVFICICSVGFTQSLSLDALSNSEAQLEFVSRDGSQLTDFIMTNDGDFVIRANAFDEVVRIDDNTKNVGIGTGSGPAAKLHIFSGVATEALRLSADTGTELSFYTNATKQFSLRKLGNGNGDFVVRNENASSNTTFVNGGETRLIIEDDGDVSVGTGYTNKRLNVNVSGSDGIRIDGDNTGNAVLEINNNGSDTHKIYDDQGGSNNMVLETPNNMVFKIDGADEVARFRIGLPVNNLQINTDGLFNAAQLYVNGNHHNINAPVYGVIGQAGGISTAPRYGVFGRSTVTTGNRYGVYGTADSGTGKWGVYCSGDFYYTGNLTMTSDARLKENIRDSRYGLSQVMLLKPKTYEFRKSGVHSEFNLAEGEQFGFLAQELEEVMPEMVSTDTHVFYDTPGNPESDSSEMEVKSINYISMISVLTKAIQEQQEMIDQLNEKVSQLELKLAEKE